MKFVKIWLDHKHKSFKLVRPTKLFRGDLYKLAEDTEAYNYGIQIISV